MAELLDSPNPAERAARIALDRMYACLDEGKSFRLEAGAGAGKTYSLVKALRYVIERQAARMRRANQRVACITFTRVASDQISSQIDRHPVVWSSTIHSFCWSLIGTYQPFLRSSLCELVGWEERLSEIGGIGRRDVEYDLGHPRAEPGASSVSLGHDDVLSLTVLLMEERKFRDGITGRFPLLFIDEYQDTDMGLASSLCRHFIQTGEGPQIGLFGDSWQKIYTRGCGLIDHGNLVFIGKEANFRSAPVIVRALNRMRPDLPQEVEDPTATGRVSVFHTNDWPGVRRKRGVWAGDLPPEAAHGALQVVRRLLLEAGWDFSPQQTKILMLTHGVLAAEQDYRGIAAAFRYNESFAKKESPHIAFLVDVVERVCVAYRDGRYGDMFGLLGIRSLGIRSRDDKIGRARVLDRLLELRESGTIGQILDYLRRSGCPPLPKAVEVVEAELLSASAEEVEESRTLREVRNLRRVPYQEIVRLSMYLDERTPFSTKHGVKGAEFENVLVVFGRGWSSYNWSKFLEWSSSGVPSSEVEAYERNRNLFYVACSRPRRRLALLFTQKLSVSGLRTLAAWYGEETIQTVGSF